MVLEFKLRILENNGNLDKLLYQGFSINVFKDSRNKPLYTHFFRINKNFDTWAWVKIEYDDDSDQVEFVSESNKHSPNLATISWIKSTFSKANVVTIWFNS